MATKNEAEEIVEKVARGNGYNSHQTWQEIQENLTPKAFKQIQDSVNNLRETASESIQTLASEIYSDNARFVFELLKNGDDNCFTKPRPFVHFELHPDQVVVKCSEDDFTEENFRAMFSICKSYIKDSHGYIGNRGISFKFVFAVASKVQIKSGDMSFRFEHGTGVRGLGMTTAISTQPPKAVAVFSGTRMKLYLHTTGNPQSDQYRHETIAAQLGALQPTCLLFLKYLNELIITCKDAGDKNSSSKIFTSDDIVRLKIMTRNPHGGVQELFKKYRKVSQKLSRLPHLESRSERDLEAGGVAVPTSGEVVLAFPLPEDGTHLNHRQQLFAFLSLRNSDYKFIIHPDFDTSANRQDIVTTSLRNEALPDHIASTFMSAIGEFCDGDGELCFHRVAFLPIIGQTHSNFWKRLGTQIARQIPQSPTFVPCNKKELQTTDQVVELKDDLIEEDVRETVSGTEIIMGEYTIRLPAIPGFTPPPAFPPKKRGFDAGDLEAAMLESFRS